MKMIVGLGNPGRKYASTRHNVGFEVAAELARRHAQGRVRVKFEGETVEAGWGGEKVLLLCPQTFMNRSGLSVQRAADFYQLDSAAILVVCDDFHLALGRLRIRRQGSAGGQKGLQDILSRLSTQEIPRLRLGIGEPPPRWEVADYVLSRFSKSEQETMAVTRQCAADAAEDWVTQGIEYCMNKYNAG